MASDKKWHMHEKNDVCKILAKLGVLLRFHRGGGGIQILAKKGQFSKLVYVMKTKIFLTWLDANLLY